MCLTNRLHCLHIKIPAKPSVPLIALSYITAPESIWPGAPSLLVGEIRWKNKRVEHKKQTKHTHRTKQTKNNQLKTTKSLKNPDHQKKPPKKIKLTKNTPPPPKTEMSLGSLQICVDTLFSWLVLSELVLSHWTTSPY